MATLPTEAIERLHYKGHLIIFSVSIKGCPQNSVGGLNSTRAKSTKLNLPANSRFAESSLKTLRKH